jgi:hypothetical protein
MRSFLIVGPVPGLPNGRDQIRREHDIQPVFDHLSKETSHLNYDIQTLA